MADILFYIFIALISVAASLLTQYFIKQYRSTYRWKCKVCGFKIKNKILYDFKVSVGSHNHSRLKEFKDTDPWNSPETKAACLRFHPGEICKPGENHPGTDGRPKWGAITRL